MTKIRKDRIMKQSEEGNFNWSEFEQEAIDRLKQGDELGGKEGILDPMIKRLLESALEGDLELFIWFKI